MRKRISIALIVALVWSFLIPGAYAQTTAVGPPGLVQVEEILYGRAQEGSLLSRLERVETDVLGGPDTGAFLVRVQRMVGLLTGAEGEVSLKMKLNAVEWAMFQSVNEGLSIARRLDQLESAMFGETYASQGIVPRLNNLVDFMWPGGRVHVAERTVPKGTLVKIELLTELNSERSRPNDVVTYRVAEDVRIDNAIVIPAGALGQGHVISVDAAGRLGQDGLVQVDFGRISTIDSKNVAIDVAERATEQNRSLELAAGASIAGVLLLGGPIGLAAGYFVQGKSHVVPVGTTFYAETASEVRVNALSLIPIPTR